MEQYLIGLSTNHSLFVYALIIFLACAEGPILSMLFGVLLKLGYFDFIPVYTALMIGDVLGDSIWYWVGRKFGLNFVKKYGRYVSINEKKVERGIELLHKHKNPLLFISKITNGLGLSIVVLISAGIAKLPFYRYLAVNLTGQFVWTGMLLGIGYFLGNLYLRVNTWFDRIGIILVAILLFLIFLGYKKYLTSKI